jgi:hypothetical protein
MSNYSKYADEGLQGRICPICGKEFFPTEEWAYKFYYYRRGKMLTCSRPCYRQATAESERLKEEAKQQDKRKKRGEKE